MKQFSTSYVHRIFKPAAVLLLACLPLIALASSLPGHVQNIQGMTAGPHCVRVMWDAEPCAASYNVEFQYNGSTYLFQVVGTSVTFGVPTGETGRVRVQAVNSALQSGPFSFWKTIYNSGNL